MPTAARMIAAIAFAAVAFLASEVFKPLLPEGTQVGLLSIVNAVIGLFVGWMVVGSRAGKGYAATAGVGIGGSCVLLFFAILGWSIYQMILKSMRPGTFGGAADALNGAFGIMFDHLTLISTDARISFDISGIGLFLPQVYIVLLIGGIVGGWLAEWAQERAR